MSAGTPLTTAGWRFCLSCAWEVAPTDVEAHVKLHGADALVSPRELILRMYQFIDKKLEPIDPKDEMTRMEAEINKRRRDEAMARKVDEDPMAYVGFIAPKVEFTWIDWRGQVHREPVT